MKKSILIKMGIFSLVMLALSFTGCKKEKGCTDPKATNYNPDAEEDDKSCEYNDTTKATLPAIPTTYNFTNVSYGGQTVRLLLLKDLETKMETAETTPVTAAELNAILDNSAGAYSTISSGKKLSDKISSQAIKDSIQKWFSQIEIISASTTKGYLRADSVDLKQMVAKTLMGSVFYYRAVNDYLNNVPNKDNSTVVAGEGTTMEHNFDEAFGYFGAARDYNSYTDVELAGSSPFKDSNSDGVTDDKSEKCFFYSLTAGKRDKTSAGFSDGKTDYTKTFFDAFLKARWGISNKQYTDRDNAITVIKETWDLLIAATVVHYINDVKDEITANKSRTTHWAEMKGYLNMIPHNTNNKLGTTIMANLNTLTGNNPNAVTVANLNEALATLKNYYGFTQSQIDGF